MLHVYSYTVSQQAALYNLTRRKLVCRCTVGRDVRVVAHWAVGREGNKRSQLSYRRHAKPHPLLLHLLYRQATDARLHATCSSYTFAQ